MANDNGNVDDNESLSCNPQHSQRSHSFDMQSVFYRTDGFLSDFLIVIQSIDNFIYRPNYRFQLLQKIPLASGG